MKEGSSHWRAKATEMLAGKASTIGQQASGKHRQSLDIGCAMTASEPRAIEHGKSSRNSSQHLSKSPPTGTKLGELGRSPGSREEPCSWVSRAMEGKRQLLHATSPFQTFYTQPSSTQPQELVLQQKNLPRKKTEDSGVRQREHTACAEICWDTVRFDRGNGEYQWDQEAIVPNPM